jgi:hypothetical protein
MLTSISVDHVALTWKFSTVADSAVMVMACIPTFPRVRSLYILLSKDVQWRDDDLNCIQNEQEWHPEH